MFIPSAATPLCGRLRPLFSAVSRRRCQLPIMSLNREVFEQDIVFAEDNTENKKKPSKEPPFRSLSMAGCDPDPRWANFNWKAALEKIVSSSMNPQLRAKVAQMAPIFLTTNVLQAESMSSEFVQFWNILLEYIAEIDEEVGNANRVLSEEMEDGNMSDQDALYHDNTILARDSTLHGTFGYIRNIINELGHNIGEDDHLDDIASRTELLYDQLEFYIDEVLKIP